jgi:chromosome segregation ATPase
MSDRELRDRVEALYDQLKQVRAELEVPETEELVATRTRVLGEIAALEARSTQLIRRLPQLAESIEFARDAADEAEKELRKARAAVAAREDLGNPLAESRSNWEDQSEPPGCNLGVLLFATFAALALAAGWWS